MRCGGAGPGHRPLASSLLPVMEQASPHSPLWAMVDRQADEGGICCLVQCSRARMGTGSGNWEQELNQEHETETSQVV